MHNLKLSGTKIKEIKKLHLKKYRDELNLYIIEGYKAVIEAINSNIEIKEIYSLKSFDMENYSLISEEEMKKISTTSSACEILAIAKKRGKNIGEFTKYKRIALFENIQDPGNLGTIIRSASAFNIDAIILYGDCVDLYSPKVIRSCAGNFYKTPVIELKNNSDLKTIFKNHQFIATSLSKENNISTEECKAIDKIIIMFGSEASGLSKNLTKISDKNIRLNMNKNVESLNLAVSASIIFWELYKKQF